MKKPPFLVYLFAMLLLGLQGCLPIAAAAPAPSLQAQAPEIRSVEVLQSGDPQQIMAVVQAVLPDTCSGFGEPSVERQGQAFTVTLPAAQASGQVCQPASISQDRVIRLTEGPLAPGNYIVLVNGVLASFRVAAPAQPERAQAQAGAVQQARPAAPPEPQATPTAEPTQAPAPTATPLPTEAPLPSPTPTAALLALPAGAAAANCSNKAAFYGTLTVPDGTPFQPGAKFTKTWLVMNAGSCAWGPGYSLVFAGGDLLGAQQKVPLPKASPRQVVQVSVDMTAPIAPQKYESNWAFETPEGYLFGLGNPPATPLAAKISVVPLPVGVPSGLDCGALRLRDMEAQVLEQINSTRAEHGLYPLELVEDISRTALKHSLEMACYDRTSHYGRDGMLYNVRLQRDSILFATSNEIIYSGNGGPKGAIDWWMKSPIHKPIVLSTQYTQVGIGYVFYDKNDYQQRITVDFIHP